MATTKLDIRFTFKVERSPYGGEHDTFKAHLQYMAEPTEWNKSGVRNPVWRDDTDELSALADLSITAQRGRDGFNGGDWYAFSFEYNDVHSVDLLRAKVMARTLGTVERKMAKLEERFGYPRDLADFCARCADVMGATVRYPFGQYHAALQMDGTHYRWTDVDGLRSAVSKEVTV